MITLRVLLESLPRHLGWWLQALAGWRHPCAPLRPRRLVMLVLGFPLFVLVQGIHGVCLLLDEVLFPRYRRVEIGQALFITGIPRSGTTFLHRTLATEQSRYTTITTWEALLAPSILQRRIVELCAALDRRLGGFVARGLRALTRRLAGELADIHEVGMEAAEEDYLALLPAGGCFILLLAFPAAPGLRQLGHMDDDMPPGRRQRMLRFYHRCLQRHIYADGGQRRLLSKNAAFGSWIQGLRQICPQARFILCVREPTSALSSQISSIRSAQALFGARVDGEALQRIFLDQFEASLQHMADILPDWPEQRAVVVDMADLRRAQAAVIRALLAQLALPVGDALAAHLAGLPASTGRSRHQHRSGDLAIPAEELAQRLLPPYYRLLDLPQRVGVPE
ncbi:sulfotransferase [Thiohalophilus sp.]|uniref:sulfotransferase n=1 Tax=Thiohalophilus sp. TaxID=3028392 RepID=UPI002ACEEF2C|nr:sulfotransferase [Thiohalophilus sp.]MDZ7802585.1 sulfotransferase [Thiohalophilus sp.]